jgi:hypothetical protein
VRSIFLAITVHCPEVRRIEEVKEGRGRVRLRPRPHPVLLYAWSADPSEVSIMRPFDCRPSLMLPVKVVFLQGIASQPLNFNLLRVARPVGVKGKQREKGPNSSSRRLAGGV